MSAKDELITHLKQSIEKNGGDPESTHSKAESLLLAYLRELGEDELAALWDEASSDWWYA